MSEDRLERSHGDAVIPPAIAMTVIATVAGAGGSKISATEPSPSAAGRVGRTPQRVEVEIEVAAIHRREVTEGATVVDAVDPDAVDDTPVSRLSIDQR